MSTSLKLSVIKPSTKYHLPSTSYGFTIVELLVVIVVIGILAAITTVSYRGISSRAQMAKMNEDLTTLSKAVQMARITTSKTMGQITNSWWTTGWCVGFSTGTDLAAVSRSHTCWIYYLSALDSISVASGMNVRNMVDPWGRPYYIDENEGEGGTCGLDGLSVYAQPYNGTDTNFIVINIPLSHNSGCP